MGDPKFDRPATRETLREIPLATLTPQIVTYFADSHFAMCDT
jgi:hypothetical protein